MVSPSSTIIRIKRLVLPTIRQKGQYNGPSIYLGRVVDGLEFIEHALVGIRHRDSLQPGLLVGANVSVIGEQGQRERFFWADARGLGSAAVPGHLSTACLVRIKPYCEIARVMSLFSF